MFDHPGVELGDPERLVASVKSDADVIRASVEDENRV